MNQKTDGGSNRITDAKVAFAALVDLLNENDIFQVRTFSTTPTTEITEAAYGTAENKEVAKLFVKNLKAGGTTALGGAIGASLSQLQTMAKMAKETPDMYPQHAIPILVAMTDGIPTDGSGESIYSNVKCTFTYVLGILMQRACSIHPCLLSSPFNFLLSFFLKCFKFVIRSFALLFFWGIPFCLPTCFQCSS